MPHVHITNAGDGAHRMGAKGSRVGGPFAHGDTLYEGPARIVALSTIPYWGFGFRAFPYANERVDRMQLRLSTISAGPFLRNFKAIWRGDYEASDLLFDYLVEAVKIEIDPPSPFQIGGDYVGIREKIEACLTAESIRLVDFYAPPNAA
jgi:diacylglycerol kinase family enzyme